MDFATRGLWKCRGRVLEWGGATRIMGVLNVTPDSFYDGGRHLDLDAAITHGRAMYEAGADLIDVGGESSRPGSRPVSASEEMKRVIPVIAALSKDCPVLISVDTTKPDVARAALEAGAHVVNDISAGRAGDAMFELVRDYNAGLILMHMQGSPTTMQSNPMYRDVVSEVFSFLQDRVRIAEAAGVSREAMAVDPGIGFGKTFDHNWQLLQGLRMLTRCDLPVAVGCSRKRFLGVLCDRETTDRLPASLAALTVAILNGAAIIRVHDVIESCDAARVADRVRAENAAHDEMDGTFSLA